MNVVTVGAVPPPAPAPPAVAAVSDTREAGTTGTHAHTAADRARAERAERAKEQKAREQARPEPPPVKVLSLPEMRALLGQPSLPKEHQHHTPRFPAAGRRIDGYA